MANHKDKKIIWNGGERVIREGEILTGRKELSKKTGISQTSIERILEYLENGHQIGQQKTTKFRIISIVNWHEYQKADTKTDNKRTTNGQQTDTNNNDKNEKNDKNTITNTAGAVENKQIAEIINTFKGINPTINFGHTTHRKSITTLIGKFGYDQTLATAKYAVGIQGQPYTPVITTPTQLINKLGDLKVYAERQKQKSPTIVKI